MRTNLTTERLLLEQLSVSDAPFIMELVNSEGWLAFIGQRNVHSVADAEAYIQKIISNPNIIYWCVKLKTTKVPVGIVTCIKRDYLEHFDIGFALLPAFGGKGYAYESAKAVLDHLAGQPDVNALAAVTLPHNTASIQLLRKLGLAFDAEIEANGDTLHLYKIQFG